MNGWFKSPFKGLITATKKTIPQEKTQQKFIFFSFFRPFTASRRKQIANSFKRGSVKSTVDRCDVIIDQRRTDDDRNVEEQHFFESLYDERRATLTSATCCCDLACVFNTSYRLKRSFGGIERLDNYSKLKRPN